MKPGSPNTRRVWLWSYAPLVLWTGVIFALSSPGASAANTSLIIGPLLHFFFPGMSEASQDLVHFYVRKTAHFSEYGILALLTFRAASRAGLFRLRWLLPLILVATVASLDEYNQSFEPSRTSSVYDVLLDICGGVTATVACFLGLSFMSRRRDRAVEAT